MTSLGTDGELKTCDLTQGKLIRRVPREAWEPARVLVSRNLKTVVSVPEDAPLKVWDGATGRLSQRIRFEEPRSVARIAAISGLMVTELPWHRGLTVRASLMGRRYREGEVS